MKAGKLRHWLRLESKLVTGRDSMGADVYTWQPEQPAPVAGEVDPVGGRRFFAAVQEQAEAELIFRIRWHPRIDTTWRVVWEDKAYLIEEIKEADGAKHRDQYLRCVTMQHAEDVA